MFKLNEDIQKEIKYDGGELFIKDRNQGKINNKEIFYKCKNNRKDERIHTKAFCKALIKRKIEKKHILYIRKFSFKRMQWLIFSQFKK